MVEVDGLPVESSLSLWERTVCEKLVDQERQDLLLAVEHGECAWQDSADQRVEVAVPGRKLRSVDLFLEDVEGGPDRGRGKATIQACFLLLKGEICGKEVELLAQSRYRTPRLDPSSR